jgi:hypothetical protein
MVNWNGLPSGRLRTVAVALLAAVLAACSQMPQKPTAASLDVPGGGAAAVAQLGTQWGEGRESRVREVKARRLSPSQPDDQLAIAYNSAEAVRAQVGRRPQRQLNVQLAQGDVEWSVRDENDRPLPLQRVDLEGLWQVAGAEGRRYVLVFRNLSERAYEVVATVDGLDVLNGKPGSLRNDGYVLMPNDTLRIEGFRKSGSEVAAFRFSAPARAYAANTEAGDARNVGVLGSSLRAAAWFAQRCPRAQSLPGGRARGQVALCGPAALSGLAMKAPLRLFAALAWVLGAASAAQAMSIRELRTLEAREQKDGKVYVEYYLVGVMEGLREASDAAQRNGGKPLFCVGDRRLQPSMARSLYQGELRRHADLYEADMPVQLVLSAALQNSYRCH